MPGNRIRLALMSGTMRVQAEGLADEQIGELVKFLSSARPSTPAATRRATCAASNAALVDPLAKPHWNGWGVSPLQHRFQHRGRGHRDDRIDRLQRCRQVGPRRVAVNVGLAVSRIHIRRLRPQRGSSQSAPRPETLSFS